MLDALILVSIVAAVEFVAVCVFWWLVSSRTWDRDYYKELSEDRKREIRKLSGRVSEWSEAARMASRDLEAASQKAEYYESLFREESGRVSSLRVDLADARRVVETMRSSVLSIRGCLEDIMSRVRAAATEAVGDAAAALSASECVDWSGCGGIDPRPLSVYEEEKRLEKKEIGDGA